MGQAEYDLNYHIVFATKHRVASLTPPLIKQMETIVFKLGREIGFDMHAVNGYVDHVHLLLRIPPSLSIATVVKRIKGRSSRYLEVVYWQVGYWVSGIERRSFANALDYIENQWEHHQHKQREKEGFFEPPLAGN